MARKKLRGKWRKREIEGGREREKLLSITKGKVETYRGR